MANRKHKRPFISKKHRKRVARGCRICGERRHELLDVHRIREGVKGGRYSWANSVVLCASCHRKHHHHLITIKGWVNFGWEWRLRVVDRNGDEDFV